MKNDFIRQYDHSWKVFVKIVETFDQDAWMHTGRKGYTPARLSYHILKSNQYYIGDPSTFALPSGKAFSDPWQEAADENLPTQQDIAAFIHDQQEKTEAWIQAADLSAKNDDYPWAGDMKFGVVVFLLRHSLYHIGELSSLLNESKHGEVEDIYFNI